MTTRRLALDGVIVIATIAMRLSPLERDLLATGIFALHDRFWPPDSP